MSWHRTLLALLFIIAVVAFCLGLYNTLEGNFNIITWMLCPIGIFCWGDALILGPFLAISAACLWYKDKPLISGMFLSLYVIVRAFIEILYNLNAQFTTTTRPWEIYWQSLPAVRALSIIDTDVLAQVFYTVITIVFLFIFIVLLKKYLEE